MSKSVQTTNNSARPKRLAITIGEPAGIGPEIALRAAWQLRAQCQSVLIGDGDFLQALTTKIDPAICLQPFDAAAAANPEALAVLHTPLAQVVVPGVCDPRNSTAVLAMLDLAIDGALQGRFDAIVTAPLQKSVINEAGVPFSGHTEYLAQRSHTDKVVMMLAASHTAVSARPLRVALATTHLPLRAVADAINAAELSQVIDILHLDLCRRFGIAAPVILVAGLNPHAGEGGYLGREEIDIIAPVIALARARGLDVRGPYPADTLFQAKYLDQADCVLAMYHDQGLPVLKYASFGNGVNITLGLPFIRSSVDHGTALDIAARGLGHAEFGSMLAAMQTALEMCHSH